MYLHEVHCMRVMHLHVYALRVTKCMYMRVHCTRVCIVAAKRIVNNTMRSKFTLKKHAHTRLRTPCHNVHFMQVHYNTLTHAMHLHEMHFMRVL